MANFIIDSYKMSHTDFFTFRNPIKSLKPEIISILGYTALGLLACRLKPSLLPTDIAISFTKKTILCLASSSLNLSFISLVISATCLWRSSDFSKSYEASHKSENCLLSQDYLRKSKWQFGRTFIYLAVSLLALHTLKRLSPSTSFDLSSLSLAHLTYDKLISYSRFSFVHKLFPFIIATVANYGLSKKTSYSLIRFIDKNEASLNLIEKYNLLGTEESFCEILEMIRDSSTLKPVVDHKKFIPNQRNMEAICGNWYLQYIGPKYVLDKYKDSPNFRSIFEDTLKAAKNLPLHAKSIVMEYKNINPNHGKEFEK
ncbi:MAG: hypothetical protein ACOVOR_02685 [Rhabdochlamydiaceae bacterium]